MLERKANLQDRKEKAKQAREEAYALARMASTEDRKMTNSAMGTISHTTLDLNTN